LEFARLQFIRPAYVGIDICTHDNFAVGREFAEESIQRVEEANI
jgi:hypothetical protein